MNALQVINLRKSFGDGQVKAVDDVTFTVPSGIIFGLVGRNGAGKTTTIRMIMDIYRPDSGKILFNGNERGPEYSSVVGYLPEERGLYVKMTVMENLLFLAEIKGVKASAIKPKVNEYLERFELAANANSVVANLSKGNQQKVQVIGTILHDPQLVILDEPFSGMDPVNTNILKDVILDLKKAGKIVMLSTHMMDIAERMCDHVALVHKGKLVLNASVSDIKKQFSESNITLDYDGDISFLKTIPYVKQVQDFGKSTSIRVLGNQYTQNLLAELIKHNVVVKKFEADNISLHDIFVSMTRGNNDEPQDSPSQDSGNFSSKEIFRTERQKEEVSA